MPSEEQRPCGLRRKQTRFEVRAAEQCAAEQRAPGGIDHIHDACQNASSASNEAEHSAPAIWQNARRGCLMGRTLCLTAALARSTA